MKAKRPRARAALTFFNIAKILDSEGNKKILGILKRVDNESQNVIHT